MSVGAEGGDPGFARQLQTAPVQQLLPLVQAKLQYLLSLCQSTADAKVDAQIVADIRKTADRRPEVLFGFTRAVAK